ncbi:MAG TPA: ABC transporter permease [bacterium]|nr:ABC transporter permease [bacterium]
METAAGLLEAAVRIALPILLVVVGEIVAERAGVLNIGLEGMILAGALGGFAGAWVTGSPWGGLLVGAAAGVLLAALFALLVVRWALDPIVSGVALNILALGATGVLFRALTEGAGGTVFVATFPSLAVPGLAELPLLGSALFRLNALGYATVALAVATAFFLGRTSPGLILRAAGENPDAVETAGLNVARVRFLAVLFGGLTAGAAGVYLSCGYSDTFVENMSAGRGFVALAIVVFARWSPLGGAAGALLFGLATSLQVRLQGVPLLGAEIPYQFFQMLPYALTLFVLAFTSRPGAGAPAALARPWRRAR